MKKFISIFVLLISFASIFELHSANNNDPVKDSLLFHLGVNFMLTENFLEAEACFRQFEDRPETYITAINNRGVNLCMWALSLLNKEEAQGLVKYVFPFEVAPNTKTKGEGTKEEERKQQISQLLAAAAQAFETVISTTPTFAGGYLNAAACQALTSRWEKDPVRLKTAFANIQQAEKYAEEGSTTRGYSLVVKGILYDYLGNADKAAAIFELAREQYAVSEDQNLGSLINRNIAVNGDAPAVFTNSSGEQFNVMEDEPERIDGASLGRLLSAGSIQPEETVAQIEEATFYRKNYPSSFLYIYYRDQNRFLLFHQTSQDYQGASSKGIKIGDNVAYVQKQYGAPYRIRPASGGKYLFYKKAKLLFFIGNDGTVKHWTIWRGKK